MGVKGYNQPELEWLAEQMLDWKMRFKNMRRISSGFQQCVFAIVIIIVLIGILGCRTFPRREAGSDPNGLVGFWRLSVDARDSSGRNNHGVNHLVEFDPQGFARFNGRFSYIEVPSNPSLDLGSGPFTLSAWVDIGTSRDDIPGDIMSQYDPDARRGINLGIKTLQGITVSQSNIGNVEFGIDDSRIEPAWRDCGRPGNAVFVFALCVYHGDLYAGIYEQGKNEHGHVYRYKGDKEWEDCGSPDSSNSVVSFAVYGDDLYAGTGYYPAIGSALPNSENQTPGGKVYRYEGGKNWVDCGGPEGVQSMGAMAVFKNRLFASASKVKGAFVYDGQRGWNSAGIPGDARCFTLTAYNGALWSGGDVYIQEERGGVFRSNGMGEWTFCGRPGISPGVKSMQLYSFQIYEGQLHIGVWPTAEVLRYEGNTSWTSIGRPGEEKEIMGVAVYNGKFYVGTLPLAKVFRFDGDGRWTDTGQLDTTPDVKYRRAWSMAVFQGRLYCGTLPSGRVYSIEAGRCVTHDHELGSGWHHIAAVREQGKLKLYIDRRMVATSREFRSQDFDLTNGKPLKIGFGQHDYFYGQMKNIRVYKRALPDNEIEALFRAERAGIHR